MASTSHAYRCWLSCFRYTGGDQGYKFDVCCCSGTSGTVPDFDNETDFFGFDDKCDVNLLCCGYVHKEDTTAAKKASLREAALVNASNGDAFSNGSSPPPHAAMDRGLGHDGNNLPSAHSSAKSSGKSEWDSNVSQILLKETDLLVRRLPGGALQIQKRSGDSALQRGGEETSSAVDADAAVTPASTVKGSSLGPSVSQRPCSVVQSSVGLPSLPFNDWELQVSDIIFAKDGAGDPVKLGSGAFGTVYKATIDGVTEVAVKVFHESHNEPQSADILREVAIIKSCRDKNIVQFVGACVLDDRIMLVTELMESGDLWQMLQQHRASGALSWYNRGRKIALDVARGLYFLHRHKIIHFDLKSPNVLLSKEGTAKISDVGFANILSNTHLSARNGAFTFAWAAPELLMGKNVSSAADIFSYGIILHEIVTGQQPRRGQLRDCIVPQECPEEVDQLIQRCLATEPKDRPCCKEIVEILMSVADVQPPLLLPGEKVPAPESTLSDILRTTKISS